MKKARCITVEFNVDPVQKLVLGVFFGAAIKNLSDLTVMYEDGRVRLIWTGTENGVCCHVKLSARIAFCSGQDAMEQPPVFIARDKLFSYAVRYLTSTTASLATKANTGSESILNKIVPTRMEVECLGNECRITSLSFGSDGVDVITFTARSVQTHETESEE